MEATAIGAAVAEQAGAAIAGKTPSRCAIAFCFDALMVRSGALLKGAPDRVISVDGVPVLHSVDNVHRRGTALPAFMQPDFRDLKVGDD